MIFCKSNNKNSCNDKNIRDDNNCTRGSNIIDKNDNVFINTKHKMTNYQA